MKANGSSPLRAGVLFLALAGIGSTGCMTIAILDSIDHKTSSWQAESAWRQRVAELKRKAVTGDPKARMELVDELASGYNDSEWGKRELKDALAMLTELAEQDDGPAQRKLGEYLVDVRVPGFRTMRHELRDHARGVYWLQRSVTHGCDVKLSALSDPASAVADVMAASGRREEALAWRARYFVECGPHSGYYILSEVIRRPSDRRYTVDQLTLLLLTEDADAIAKAKRQVSADDFAAAEQLAESVRPRLAAIQREFPRHTPAASTATVPTSN